MMPSANEEKQDIRLRIADLEKKLAKSEEKRRELEEACDVLIRVFREEEKMHYSALNKKYEKFLEDYSVRRRRNDIILTSLCRIEDRSRALFTKTERLKLLKDQYISYLKINELKYLWKNFPIASVKAKDDATTKAVRWKTPLALSSRSESESREGRGEFLPRHERHNTLPDGSMPASFDVDQYGRGNSNEFQECVSQRNGVGGTLDVDFHGAQTNVISVEIKCEELARDRSRIMGESTLSKNDNKLEVKHSTEVAGTEVIDHQESTEKPRITVEYPGSEWYDPNYRILSEYDDVRSNEIDSFTVQSNSFNELTKSTHHAVTSSPKSVAHDEHDARSKDMALANVQTVLQEKEIQEKTSPKTDKTLPLGMDGVDYQNETYPESYYEQPAHHHNHTSIASDVILEEDETEQDLDEEEKNLSSDDSYEELPQLPTAGEDGSQGVKTWKEVNGRTGVVGLRTNCSKESELSGKGYLKSGDFDEVFGNVKSQQSDSEKSPEAKHSVGHPGEPKSSPNDRAATEKFEKSKTATKSNLIHMLESDSESFQIEHGDSVSGNEDSDFDFSFSKK